VVLGLANVVTSCDSVGAPSECGAGFRRGGVITVRALTACITFCTLDPFRWQLYILCTMMY
jgi:hypothetical protein